MSREYVENLTMAYIYSYNIAMREVKNPNFATQIAMSVITTINMGNEHKQQMPNPLKILFEHMSKVREQEGENNDGDENEEN